MVAVQSQLSIASSVNDNSELKFINKQVMALIVRVERTHSSKRYTSHDNTICNAIDDDSPGEDTMLERVGRSTHHVRRRFLETKTKGRRRTSKHIDPQNTDRAQWEHTGAVAVQEAKSDD